MTKQIRNIVENTILPPIRLPWWVTKIYQVYVLKHLPPIFIYLFMVVLLNCESPAELALLASQCFPTTRLTSVYFPSFSVCLATYIQLKIDMLVRLLSGNSFRKFQSLPNAKEIVRMKRKIENGWKANKLQSYVDDVVDCLLKKIGIGNFIILSLQWLRRDVYFYGVLPAFICELIKAESHV